MSGEGWFVRNRDEAKALIDYINEHCHEGITFKLVRKQRTSRQNAGMHAYCDEVARRMAAAGLDMKTVIKDGVPITPTKEIVKEYMWRSIQRALFNVESTEDLETDQVNKVYEVMSHLLAEKYGISVPFGRE